MRVHPRIKAFLKEIVVPDVITTEFKVVFVYYYKILINYSIEPSI